jgi:hypothetical protein
LASVTYLSPFCPYFPTTSPSSSYLCWFFTLQFRPHPPTPGRYLLSSFILFSLFFVLSYLPHFYLLARLLPFLLRCVCFSPLFIEVCTLAWSGSE